MRIKVRGREGRRRQGFSLRYKFRSPISLGCVTFLTRLLLTTRSSTTRSLLSACDPRSFDQCMRYPFGSSKQLFRQNVLCLEIMLLLIQVCCIVTRSLTLSSSSLSPLPRLLLPLLTLFCKILSFSIFPISIISTSTVTGTSESKLVFKCGGLAGRPDHITADAASPNGISLHLTHYLHM